MYFPEYDDETEIGPPSLVNNDNEKPIEGTEEGNTFWGNLREIWGAIQTTLDAMNNPFAGDDISDADADTAYNAITTEYERLLTTYYKCGDDDKSCSDSAGIPEYITWTPPRKEKKASSGRDATFTNESQVSQLTEGSPFGSQMTSQDDITKEEVAAALSPGKTKSLINSSSISNSPPFRRTIDDFPTINYYTTPLSRQSSRDKLDSGVSLGTIANKSIIQGALEEESDADKLAIQTVATSILSDVFRQEKMDVLKALARGDASKVYKLIAKILYRQNVPIDVRNEAQRGKSNEGQMREIWGSSITDFAKSAEAKCYLCGGQIVPYIPNKKAAGGARQGGQPEMEHKLPCAVFYAKFAFIYTCFSNELTAWRTYVANLDDNYTRLKEYYIRMNSSDGTFNAKNDLGIMYTDIKNVFLRSLGEDNSKYKNLDLFLDIVLPAYLSEFAYSHHLCNRLKSNHDLNDDTKLDNYYKGLQAILNMSSSGCNKTASTGILHPACIDSDICNGERAAIYAGLFPNKKDWIKNRKENVKAQMNSLNIFATEYAKNAKTTEKRMILHTIKEIIRTMKIPIASDKNVKKKEIKQMNAQARIIAQGLNLYSADVVDASNFLDQLNKDKIKGDERDRSKDKAIDRINIYLDRIHIIFEHAYDKPTNIESQLKNAYVSPKIKIQIYNNAKNYYDKLNAILDDVNYKIRTMNMTLSDEDNQIISECENSVGSLSNILTKYQEKIPEWKRQNEPIPMGRQSSATATFLGIQKPGQKSALKRQQNKEANAMELAEIQKPRKNIALEKKKKEEEANVKKRAEMEAKKRAEAKRQAEAIRQANAERLVEAERLAEAKKRAAIREREERAAKNTADARNMDTNKRRKLLGGGAGKTRKLKRRPRKTTKRVGQQKRTIKRKYRSHKNTRRR